MKRLMLLIPLVIVLLSTACNSKTQSKSKVTQNLKFNIVNDPQTLDPRKARSLADINLITMFFEGLTRIDSEGNPALSLAKSCTLSEDKKTYHFTLKDAFWSNGDPLLAQDFVYAWKESLSPSFLSDNAYQLYPIKNAKAIKAGELPKSLLGAKALDEKNLEIQLESPLPYFLELLSTPIYFPINAKNSQKNPHWAENPATYISNGPFSLKEWKHQNSIEAEKNLFYWDEKSVKLQHVSLYMVDEDTDQRMFEQKEIHWSGSPYSTLPLDSLEKLRETNKLESVPILGTFFIRINTDKAPFNNPKVRKALALAINRQDLITFVTQGDQIPALGLVPQVMKLNEEGYFKDADITTAKNLFREGLTEASMMKGDVPQLDQIYLTYSSSDRNHRVAQAIQHQWFEALGVNINLQPLENKVFFSTLSQKNYQLACGSWLADFNDPVNFLEVFETKEVGTNNTNWENSSFQTSLRESFAAEDEPSRFSILRRCENILMEDMPIIPIFHYTMTYLKAPNLQGVITTAKGNIDFKNAYFEEQ